MSRVFFTSDLHLGHRGILKFRPQFESQEEHDQTILGNLKSSIGKRDTVYFLGDVAFSFEALEDIASLKVENKILLVGNHDTERGISMKHLVDVYDRVYSLMKKSGFWLSHCPIHPNEMRYATGNIHGHDHSGVIDDSRYFNVCLEHTNYMPVPFEDIKQKFFR